MNSENDSSSFTSSSASTESHYDFIIAGAGAAGLSLLIRLIGSGKFKEKKILLVDHSAKNVNDRTWCFWEKGAGLFEDVVYKTWQSVLFQSDDFSGCFNIDPYRYKMIKGIDFYNHCFAIISKQSNVTVQYGTVQTMHSNEDSTWLILDEKKITAGYIFNSIIFERPVLKSRQYHLIQHFKGWIVKTPKPLFKANQATLMDFRVGQKAGTTFVYVMPFTENTALIEYTLFSKTLLQPDEYDKALDGYLKNYLHCINYEILSEEFGKIPMTNHRFPSKEGNIIYIGTAGGQTKASSGYTFQFIQKHTRALVDELCKSGKILARPAAPARFHYYDSVLLNVLATGKLAGSKIFARLFQKNPAQRIFQFLDNESSFFQEVKLISTLPTLPFLKAGLQQLGIGRQK